MTDFNLDHLKHFRFTQLFNELGWDLPAQQQPYSVSIGEETFLLDVVAHKRGVQILHCRPDAGGHIPVYATRQKIERKITSEVREHLIVFRDAARTTQVWQWVSREPGRPNQYREITWRQGEQTELLRQKLRAIAFTLDDEESLTVFAVAQRVGAGFDRDKVTKKFYTEFDKQRKAFTEFIEGIPRLGKEIAEDQRWYTAVLIDRLMFLWFLQEKLFLDGKKHYLQSRLDQHLAAATADSPSFYRRFLCPLFFRGFAEARTEGNRAAIKAEFGDVPYLNGGLFARHQLEAKYGDALDVVDAAFSKLFAFFNEWDWHLDDRPLASGREVNPDVLGYIFEKFVNQKQMGAYYTKEDITEYIGKNTILPCLLAKVRAERPGAFDTLAWPLLQQSGDTYIYPAMLKGVDLPYPAEIAEGLDTEAPNLLERRKPWNKRADDAASLPTEIWRETIARHQRTREIRAKIASGELREVGDLITYNLNIRQFVQDLIERCTDVALLKSFWFNLAGRLPRKSNEKFRHGLSVLDPTCGSGAFLFAALNILKPLYDATLRTLHAVRNDALIAGEQSSPEKWAEVDEILSRFATEKTDRAQSYAVIKHIIVNNLYGVDIEEQATEIAKLRLFLKLVALLEPGDDIEPLPDIDFNIRHGNTLVGYATAEETERAIRGTVNGEVVGQRSLLNDPWDEISIRLTAVGEIYNNYQLRQMQQRGAISHVDKDELEHRLEHLEDELNRHLAREYGVEPNRANAYVAWKESHQPFHWFVDFYPLMASGGFDVVIGNPPYVELHKLKSYRPRVESYQTATCGNLYAPMLERGVAVAKTGGYLGQIVPVSCVSTARMQPLRDVWRAHAPTTWLSHYSGDAHPSILFEGVKFRLTVVLQQLGLTPVARIHTTGFQRWLPEAREQLFTLLEYSAVASDDVRLGLLPKATVSVINSLRVLRSTNQKVGAALSNNPSHFAYAHRIVAHYVKAFDFVPFFRSERDGQKRSEDYKPFGFVSEHEVLAFAGLLNSSLFYIWFVAYSDVYHCGRELIEDFPFSIQLGSKDSGLLASSKELMAAYRRTAVRRAIPYERTGLVEYDEFYPRTIKTTIDAVDVALAGLVGLNEAELDYIINYDIKYRMGQSADDDSDD